ncbi:protein-glutamate O-methyltransferase CheR [Bacillus sp. FSL H8-0547]
MEYEQFINEIKRMTGIDLSLYKEAQMKRRLISLYIKRGCSGFWDYSERLRKEPELLAELLDKMTINVTEFYRNKKQWEMLETKLLPDMIKKPGTLKVWSAACSTGEEPYTLAMILSKYAALSDIRILATDLDETVLKRAEAGVFPERSLSELPDGMRGKYFSGDGTGYKIKNDLKKSVQFRKHNLLSDRYESGFDLIICRNVLIYFTEAAKETIYEKFSNALKPGGILFVGSTEQIFHAHTYGLESAGTFFYRKKQL